MNTIDSFNPKWAELSSMKDPELTWLSAEVKVLASLLSDWSNHSSTLGWSGLQYQLEPQHFAIPEARFFYEIMLSMRDRSIPCDDPSIFFEEVKKHSKAKPSDVMRACLPLVEATTTNVNHWARHILDGFLRRELDKAIREAFVSHSQETRARVTSLEDALQKLKESEGYGDRKFILVHQAIDGFMDLLEKRIANAGKDIQSISTEWPSLDSKLKFGRGHLIVLGGRSNMGKTSFAFNLFQRMARTGKKVAFFSLEHNKDEVLQAILAIEAGVSYEKLGSGESLDEDELDRIADARRRIFEFRMGVSDKSGATIGDIKAELEGMRRSMGGLDAVFIDHLHAIGDDKNFKSIREKFIFVSAQLKAIASAFKLPVVALAQMNRDADKRADHRPLVSDLRESSSIEQDADAILFVYRDSYYAGAGYESEKKGWSIGSSIEGGGSKKSNNPFTEVICKKNRHGSYQNFTLHFDYNPKIKRFMEASL